MRLSPPSRPPLDRPRHAAGLCWGVSWVHHHVMGRVHRTCPIHREPSSFRSFLAFKPLNPGGDSAPWDQRSRPRSPRIAGRQRSRGASIQRKPTGRTRSRPRVLPKPVLPVLPLVLEGSISLSFTPRLGLRSISFLFVGSSRGVRTVPIFRIRRTRKGREHVARTLDCLHRSTEARSVRHHRLPPSSYGREHTSWASRQRRRDQRAWRWTRDVVPWYPSKER